MSSKTEPASSTREDASSPRLFWVGMAVFLIIMVFLGFGSTYGRQLALGLEITGVGVVETDWVIHLHAAVFVGWMALLLTQTILVARGRTRMHMTLGAYGGVALAFAVLVVGLLITYVEVRAFVSKGIVTWADWPGILYHTKAPWAALGGFALLLGLGLLYRRRPEVHKRYMVFATILLASAANGRMEYLLGEWDGSIGMGLMVAPLIAYDLYREGRVRSATLVGTCVAGIAHVIAAFL